MKFIKCKNETEKINAISNYCKAQIEENNRQINWLEAEKTSPLDYMDEIAEHKRIIAHFNKIIEIIEADEFTSVMIF